MIRNQTNHYNIHFESQIGTVPLKILSEKDFPDHNSNSRTNMKFITENSFSI